MAHRTDDEVVMAWHAHGGSPSRVAKALGMTPTGLMHRRQVMGTRGIRLPTMTRHGTGGNAFGRSIWQVQKTPYRDRTDYVVKDGLVFFFGDAHWWPGEMSVANQALLILAKVLKPKLICANGDLFDGATVSRHEPLGWTKLPTVVEELDTVKGRLDEIRRASPKSKTFMSPGNHDTRYDRRLARDAGEFEDVLGFKIEDHIGKEWPMAYVAVINKDAHVPVLVMHNFRGGVHAPYNNVLHAGATIVTGHLHSQERKAHTTYFKTAYGVDHGCLADPDHPAFSYCMGRPRNWRSGFCVMQFDKNGEHYPPEFLEVQKLDSGVKRAVFRGEVICEAKVRQEHETKEGS